TEVMATTPATESGLRPGDILLQVGKVKVHEPEDVLDASFFITAGDVVPITVVRNGAKCTFKIQAELHPASRNIPMLSDRTQLPAAATLQKNRAIPLTLDADVPRTP
ncbi:MAG: PDZ domain-containing protein, partial [Chthoniobacterales bacterium]